jgi:acyl-coenzyme A thioesterase PaaI-like protein
VTEESLHDRAAEVGQLAHLDDGVGSQPAHVDETQEAADAVRCLVEAVRLADAPLDALERAVGLVREATALLDEHRVEGQRSQVALRPERHARQVRDDLLALDDPVHASWKDYIPYSPVLGPMNPVAPPATLTWDGERVHGTVVFGAPYAGPPGMTHGGVVALLFDDLLSSANVFAGIGGFTGTLTIRYERPTPLEVELRLESAIERLEGRKIITTGTISHDGQVTARAEGVFIRTQL